MPLYAQFVVGLPGSGKSTYCTAARDIMLNDRSVFLVNLDPAAEYLPYTPDLDIRDLVNFKQLCEQCDCGPNGALLTCFRLLEDNFSWLTEGLQKSAGHYVIADFPGQIELYLGGESVLRIVHRLQEAFDLRVVVLNLIDYSRCLESFSFLSSCLTSLCLLVNLSLPFVNIVTKVDIYRESQGSEVDLEEIISCENLSLDMTVFEGTSKFAGLNSAICNLLEDFNLIRFEMLSVKDPNLLAKVIQEADHACGYMLR